VRVPGPFLSSLRAARRGLSILGVMAGERLRDAEVLMLSTLRRREAARAPAPEAARPPAGPPQLLRELLDRAADQTHEEGRAALHVKLLRALVPDEARILAALEGGATYPLVHVDAGPRLGGPTHRVLANLSTVGKAAGVACNEVTPIYIAHLEALGLAESDVEDEAFEVQYEILAADGEVRVAVERIRKQRRKETVVRRVLRASALGRALWAACHPAETT
jgi:hypothetical protein